MIVTVLETVAPPAGDVMDTVGGVVSAATLTKSEIVSVAFEALLLIATLPATLPDADGANVTFSVADAPGLRMSPVEIPFAVNPAPEIETLETVTLEPPELVTVTACVLVLPTITFPKFKLELLGLSRPSALTVSVAALLVVVPKELLTVMVN